MYSSTKCWSFCFEYFLYNLFYVIFQLRYDDDDDADGPAPDPALEYGMPLPIRLAAEFPPELVATPIEDIDVFYQNKKVIRLKTPKFRGSVKTCDFRIIY